MPFRDSGSAGNFVMLSQLTRCPLLSSSLFVFYPEADRKAGDWARDQGFANIHEQDGEGLVFDDFVQHTHSKEFELPVEAVVLIFLEHTVTQPDVVNGPGDTLVCHLGIDNLLTLGVALYDTNDKHGWTSFGEEDLQSGRELLDEMVRQFMAAPRRDGQAVHGSLKDVEDATDVKVAKKREKKTAEETSRRAAMEDFLALHSFSVTLFTLGLRLFLFCCK